MRARKPRDRVVNVKSSAPRRLLPQSTRLGLEGLEWTAYSPAKDDDSLGDLRSFAYTQVTKMLQEKSPDE